jgi:hypothetical protein
MKKPGPPKNPLGHNSYGDFAGWFESSITTTRQGNGCPKEARR